MQREIKVGGLSFVVDDPNGSMARIEDRDHVVEHPENETIEATVRAAKQRQMSPMIPGTVDPIQSIRARAALFDAISDGRIGPIALGFAWFVMGIPCLVMAAALLLKGVPHLLDEKESLLRTASRVASLIFLECFPGFGLLVLWKGTRIAAARAKRRH